MKYQICIVVIILTTVVFSCKKDTLEIPSVKTETIDPTKSFLTDVKSDSTSDYYISGEFDGYKIYCSSTLADMFPSQDTMFNVLFYNDSIDLDDIHITRENHDMTVTLSLYFEKSKMFTRQFPYILPRANMGYCESAGVEFINMKKLGTTGQNAPNDDFSFMGNTNNGVTVKVTSFVDNIMQGTFEGALRTNTGSVIQVKNGSFRTKIIDYYNSGH